MANDIGDTFDIDIEEAVEFVRRYDKYRGLCGVGQVDGLVEACWEPLLALAVHLPDESDL